MHAKWMATTCIVELDSGGLIEGVAPELVGHLENSDGEEEDDY